MSADTPQAETTTANSTTSHKGRTRLGWDPDTLAWASKYALVIGGVVLAIIAALGLRWEDQVDERREVREEEYKRNAGKDIEAAKTEASRANENTAKLTNETEALKLQVAEQQERAAKAEARVLELEQRNEPRRMPPDIFNRLVDALRKSPIKGKVQVAWVSGGPEPPSYGSRFDEALKAAGWETTPPALMLDIAGFGIGIFVRDTSKAPAYAAALQQILKSVGIEATGSNATWVAEDVVQLLILTKP